MDAPLSRYLTHNYQFPADITDLASLEQVQWAK